MLAFAYVLLLAIIAFAVPLAFSLRDRQDEEVRLQSRGQADVVAATAADLLAPRQRADLRALVSTAAASVRGRVLVVDRTGRLIADSAGGGELGSSYLRRPEIAAALRGERYQETRHSQTLDEDLLATSGPIVRANRTRFVFPRASKSMKTELVSRSTRGLRLHTPLLSFSGSIGITRSTR